MSICEVVNGNITNSCRSLNVPRDTANLVVSEQLGNLQPGSYAIGQVQYGRGDEMVSFSMADIGHLQLQSIEVTMEQPPTTVSTMGSNPVVGE